MKKKIIPVLIIIFIICIALIFKFSNKNEKDSTSNTDNPSSSDIEDSENDEPKVYEDPELDGYWINQDYELFQIYKKDDDYEVNIGYDNELAFEYNLESLKNLITDEDYNLNENKEIYQIWEGDTLTYKITEEENGKYSISYLVGDTWEYLDFTSIYKEEENLLLFYSLNDGATGKSKVEWNEDLGAYEGTWVFYYYNEEDCILKESAESEEIRPSVDDENHSPFYSIDPGW